MDAHPLSVRSYWKAEQSTMYARMRTKIMRTLSVEAYRKSIALQLGCIAVFILFYCWLAIADTNARTLAYLVQAYASNNQETIATNWIVNSAR